MHGGWLRQQDRRRTRHRDNSVRARGDWCSRGVRNQCLQPRQAPMDGGGKGKTCREETMVFSIINGVRYRASEIVYGHTDEKRGSIVAIATNTKVDVARERNGFDYLELPSEITEFSRPTHWMEPLPGKAAEEIESLHYEGVTAEAWGGTSGAGVWNLALGTNADGRPDGQVLAELAGICFYANPDKGCVIAHGSKSISKIAMSHMARRNRILPSESEE